MTQKTRPDPGGGRGLGQARCGPPVRRRRGRAGPSTAVPGACRAPAPRGDVPRADAGQLLGRGAGRQPLLRSQAERAAHLTAGRADQRGRCGPGAVVDQLAGCREPAHHLVLQHRQQSRLLRVFTGSTAAGVVAHADLPVVSVPELWPGRPTGTWSSASTGPGRDDALLRHGFGEAISGAPAHVLHALVRSTALRRGPGRPRRAVPLRTSPSGPGSRRLCCRSACGHRTSMSASSCCTCARPTHSSTGPRAPRSWCSDAAQCAQEGSTSGR